MCSKKVLSTKAGLSIALTILAMLALAPYAGASQITVNFTDLPFGTAGNAPNGSVQFTVVEDPQASSNYNPAADFSKKAGQPYDWDPEGAQRITDASGAFNGWTITGIRAINRATPPSDEIPPYSYSTIGSSIDSPVASYDNLYYPGGSPEVCFKGDGFTYPFSGGIFDIYGVALKLDNGTFVDLWSNGYTPGGLSYSYKVAVPAPNFLWLFAAALVLGLLAWRRRTHNRPAPA